MSKMADTWDLKKISETTFQYIPSQKTVEAHKPRKEVLEAIVQKLIDLGYKVKPETVLRDSNADYPMVLDDTPDIWITFHSKRPIFRIKDRVYLRRYGDDWNYLVIAGLLKSEYGCRFDWSGGEVSCDQLKEILQQLDN